MARYADLSAQMNDNSGKLNSQRLKDSIDDVTGGVLHHNSGSFIAPARGMPQQIFDRSLAGIGDNDLAGVTTLAGQPITAGYLRSSTKLESIGGGRYYVLLGSNPAKPIYAYQGANTEAPQKFVLDMRNRALAAPNATQPFLAVGVN